MINVQLIQYSNVSGNLKIYRPSVIPTNVFFRYWNYLKFYLFTFFYLLYHRFTSVLYFDTISSLPALFYKKIKGSSINLMVHFHEYVTNKEYEKGMRLNCVMHKFENKMSNEFSWISHTNIVRLNKYAQDVQFSSHKLNVLKVMPNYPPLKWLSTSVNRNIEDKIKLVYIGSLGLETMYLEEIVDWVNAHADRYSIDFYSHNINQSALTFLNDHASDIIRFCGAIQYHDIPKVLQHYQVGLVLYKPVSDNYIYNAPNKIFEYFACGLDVWFPKSMSYALSLTTVDVYPKLIPVDFDQLHDFDDRLALSTKNYQQRLSKICCENVLSDIKNHINSFV